MPGDIKDKAVVSKSHRLANRHIGFCVCGGIGAVEVVKIIRELRRHGARITPFMTPTSREFITELSVAWAAGSDVVSGWGHDASHLEDLDGVIVAPATLNTLCKSAYGIADNVVSVLIAAQIGARIPVVFFPTMHVHLKNHPRYHEALRILRGWGAYVFEAVEDEGRLKMPGPEDVVDKLESVLK